MSDNVDKFAADAAGIAQKTFLAAHRAAFVREASHQMCPELKTRVVGVLIAAEALRSMAHDVLGRLEAPPEVVEVFNDMARQTAHEMVAAVRRNDAAVDAEAR